MLCVVQQVLQQLVNLSQQKKPDQIIFIIIIFYQLGHSAKTLQICTLLNYSLFFLKVLIFFKQKRDKGN